MRFTYEAPVEKRSSRFPFSRASAFSPSSRKFRGKRRFAPKSTAQPRANELSSRAPKDARKEVYIEKRYISSNGVIEILSVT